jgi:CheY-like chemotaxis protein
MKRETQMGRAAGKIVLVIDDNRDAADLIGAFAEKWGHKSFVAYDGEDGLRLARQVFPEVVFIDIAMPNIDGFQVARQLRAEAQFAKTVLIAFTGYATDEYKSKADAAGFDAFLPKPADAEDLRCALELKGEAAEKEELPAKPPLINFPQKPTTH